MKEIELVKRSARQYYFKGEDIDYYFSWILSRIINRGAEIAEVYYTASQVDESNIFSWAEAWISTAERVTESAEVCMAKKRRVSAREGYLRACSYYRTAIFGLRSNDLKFKEVLEKSRSCFRKAAECFNPAIESVDIFFEGHVLPAYFLKANESDIRCPTMIMIGGLETWLEDLYFFIGPNGLSRGYNVLIADLPGQGNNPFDGQYHRPDSEKPISAVVDYALSRPEVDSDRLALYGVSFGGYLVTRAVLFEKRIKACVANAPILNLHKFTIAQIPEAVQQADESLLALDAFPVVAMQKVCWAMGVNSPAEVIKRIKDFSIEGMLDGVECPYLILAGAGESEEQLRQAKQCYEELKVDRKDIRITSIEDGTDAHGLVDNISFMSQLVFDWLDDIFA